jgi:hypothetical protein
LLCTRCYDPFLRILIYPLEIQGGKHYELTNVRAWPWTVKLVFKVCPLLFIARPIVAPACSLEVRPLIV